MSTFHPVDLEDVSVFGLHRLLVGYLTLTLHLDHQSGSTKCFRQRSAGSALQGSEMKCLCAERKTADDPQETNLWLGI